MVRSLRSLGLIAFSLFVTAGAKAQLVNCNVFLKGNYVEVGVNWNGAFGTSTGAPAGYVTNVAPGTSGLYNICDTILHMDSTRLGFVADPARDGWTIGTPPFFGDFFVPGIPQEGWSIMADGMQANNWNEHNMMAPGTTFYDTANIFTGMVPITYYDSTTSTLDTLGYNSVYTHVPTSRIPGGNVAYSNTGVTATGTWQGMFDSVAVQQVTTVDSDNTYFNVEITLTNLASTPRNNVYYLRTVDPDNDVNQSSNFSTKNTIEAQLPNIGNNTVVSAAGTMYSAAYLAMSSTDLRAKAFFRKDNFGPDQLTPSCGTLDIIYAATDTFDYMYGQGDTLTADVAIGLVFNIGHLASADTIGAIDSAGRKTTSVAAPNRAIFTYQYSFGRNATLGVTPIGHSGTINIFPNPVQDNITVAGVENTDLIMIYDIMGRNIAANIQPTQNGNATYTMSSVVPAGSYIVLIYDKDGNIKAKQKIQKL